MTQSVDDERQLLEFADKISMLKADALLRLRSLAASCGGPVIELGPYIGGSTVALASGAQSTVVSVELGGPNPHHDSLPTTDTIADLDMNLRKVNLRKQVSIVAGHFRDTASFDKVREQIGAEGAALLFVDIHPATELALCLYAELLQPNSVIVIDDYSSEIAADKAQFVSNFVDAGVKQGILIEDGVYGWGTWFGRLNGPPDRLKELHHLIPLPCVAEQGLCWHVYVGSAQLADDISGGQSPVRLFENDRELGPPHAIHNSVREEGGGRFSHWSGHLWFSTSDGSDPRSNGRTYSITLGDRTIKLSEPVALPA